MYWHCAVPAPLTKGVAAQERADGAGIITYREFVQSGLSPRMLAQGIAERSGRERISDVFLSPDAFAHRTSEASIAEQLGEVFTACGLPRPAPADDDRIGGWQLMYQLLESDSWLITDNCAKLIDCIPQLVRHDGRVEDIRKVDGDDPADAARYGLVSGGRLAGVGAAPSRFSGFDRTGEVAPLTKSIAPISARMEIRPSSSACRARSSHSACCAKIPQRFAKWWKRA